MYPDAVVDLIATGLSVSSWVLDVGCGTGRLAAQLQRRELVVLGIDASPKMATQAKLNGVTVEVAPFEPWSPAGRAFDAVTCGQTWHWLEANIRASKAYDVLKAGGKLALVWNIPVLSSDDECHFARTYSDFDASSEDPRNAHTWAEDSPLDSDTFIQELQIAGFMDISTWSVEWPASYTADEWCRLLATESWHLALPKRDFESLIGSVHSMIIKKLRDRVEVAYETRLILAHRRA